MTDEYLQLRGHMPENQSQEIKKTYFIFRRHHCHILRCYISGELSVWRAQLENPDLLPLTFFCGAFASSELRETEKAHYLTLLVLLNCFTCI